MFNQKKEEINLKDGDQVSDGLTADVLTSAVTQTQGNFESA